MSKTKPISNHGRELLRLEEYLHAHGMLRSRQREQLLALISSQMRAFTTEEIVALARQKKLRASRSTIYATIDLFVSAGILYRLPTRLKGNLIRTTLCHGQSLAVCSHCGEIHIYRNRLTMLPLQEITPPRWSDTSTLLIYWGICPSCRKAEKQIATEGSSSKP